MAWYTVAFCPPFDFDLASASKESCHDRLECERMGEDVARNMFDYCDVSGNLAPRANFRLNLPPFQPSSVRISLPGTSAP